MLRSDAIYRFCHPSTLCPRATSAAFGMNRPPSNSADPNMACQSADAFFKNAGQFFSKLPKDLNASAAFAYERRGELVAAVTNLSLAVELYLKALAMISAMKVKRSHDLLELFGVLPQSVQASIEAKYSEALKAIPAESADAIELSITTTPFPPTPEEFAAAAAQRPSGDDIRSVLRAEKDAFSSWRYIHESNMPQGYTVFRVDFHKVALIANSLQRQLQGK